MDVVILYLFLYFLTPLEPKMKSRCLYFACRLDNQMKCENRNFLLSFGASASQPWFNLLET